MNLGFLSANKDSSKAVKPSDNCLFIIRLKKTDLHPQLNFGFTDISKHIECPGFPEILINPLNTFTIEKCGNQLIKDK